MMIQLSDLALDALGSFIYDITVKLGELSKNKNFELTNLQQTVDHVENLLQKNVPPILANNVSSRLQTYIFRAVQDIFKELHQNSLKLQDFQEEIIVQMWLATIHPLMTSFEFSFEAFRFLGLKYSSQFFMKFLDKVFAKVRNVYVVKLELNFLSSRKKILNCLCGLENLVELTLLGCNSATVIALSKNCCKLRKLDIRRSYHITDECVAAIIEFKHLKYLDIRDTYISKQGVTDIIATLPHLNVFNSCLTAAQVSLLGDCNPDISCINFYLIDTCSYVPLRFRNLTSLSISFRYNHRQNFVSLKESLAQVGSQLLILRLDNVDGTDLQFIADKCHVLEWIGLSFLNTRSLGFPSVYDLNTYSQKYPLPLFPTVECCEFRLTNCCLIQHIISSFANVKKVVLNEIYKPFCFLFKQLQDSMKDGSITELCIKGNRFQLSGCTSRLLLYRADGSVCTKNVEHLETVVKEIVNMRGPDMKRGFLIP